jgi:hypothetical protein
MSDLKQKEKDNVQANRVQTNKKAEITEKELDLDALEQVSGGGVSLHDAGKVEPTDIHNKTQESI